MISLEAAEKLCRLRTLREDQAASKLRVASAELAVLEQGLARANADLERCYAQEGFASSAEFALSSTMRQMLRGRMLQQRIGIAAAADRIATCRAQLAQASRDKSVSDALRERVVARLRAVRERRENALLQDLWNAARIRPDCAQFTVEPF